MLLYANINGLWVTCTHKITIVHAYIYIITEIKLCIKIC